MPKFRPQNRGLTLLELIVASALIMIIAAMMLIYAVPKYIQRARDAQRKADLEEYRVALEEYHTDKGSYPPESIMDAADDCGSRNFHPYLTRIKCDPNSQEPYLYIVSSDGQRYWLYTFLRDAYDPDLDDEDCAPNCDDTEGMYNYGISSYQTTTYSNGNGDDEEESGDPGEVFPPYCGGSCNPDVCGECCPGAKTRCNESGTMCYSDPSCSN